MSKSTIAPWGDSSLPLPCPLKFEGGKLYRRVRTASLSLYAPYGGAPVPGLLEMGDGFAWIEDHKRDRPRAGDAIVFVRENEWRPATEEEIRRAEPRQHDQRAEVSIT